jgi:hypothetical protein
VENEGYTDLYHLKIYIPTRFTKDGQPESYDLKSIGSILEEKDWFELYTLQDWITKQFLKYCDWDISQTIDTDNIARVFQTFDMLGIEPESIILEGN